MIYAGHPKSQPPTHLSFPCQQEAVRYGLKVEHTLSSIMLVRLLLLPLGQFLQLLVQEDQYRSPLETGVALAVPVSFDLARKH